MDKTFCIGIELAIENTMLFCIALRGFLVRAALQSNLVMHCFVQKDLSEVERNLLFSLSGEQENGKVLPSLDMKKQVFYSMKYMHYEKVVNKM